MPISNVTQWSATAASNVDIGGISLDGAVMTPSQVDNAIRELMAQVAGGITASYFIPSGSTFTNPILTLPQINDTSADHQYVFAVSELTADRTVTLPLLTGNDTLVFQAHTQTLTNKTLTTPVFSGTPTGLDASTTAKGISEFATAAEFRTGTDTARALVVSEVWTAAGIVNLTDAATVAVDMATFINANLSLSGGGSRALGNPTNPKPGQSGFILIQQGAGGNAMTFGANWFFAGGVDPTLSTGAGALDVLYYTVITSTVISAHLVKAIG